MRYHENYTVEGDADDDTVDAMVHVEITMNGTSNKYHIATFHAVDGSVMNPYGMADNYAGHMNALEENMKKNRI